MALFDLRIWDSQFAVYAFWEYKVGVVLAMGEYSVTALVSSCATELLNQYESNREIGEVIPSGIFKTIQPLTKAVVIACNSIRLFPVPLSPSTTKFSPVFSSSASFILSVIFTLSSLINSAGLLNIPQP